MRLLFVHDTKFKEDKEGNFYTGGSFNYKVWERYLKISSHFSVIARKESTYYEKKYAFKNFNPVNKGKINFIEAPNIMSFSNLLNTKKAKELFNTIEDAVYSSDAVIARLPSTLGAIAVRLAKKYDIPYIIEVVGCGWDAHWYHSNKGKIIAPISYLSQRRLVKNSEYTIYVTNKFLQKRYPTNGKSVNCSNVSLDQFNETVLEKRLDKIKNKNGKIKIGTIGAVDIKYKGQVSIIKALAKIKKLRNIDYEYDLVGGGDQTYLYSIAKKYGVEDNINFLGAISHKKVLEWLDSIDVYVQPSKTEGLPRSVIEAMSRAALVMGSNAGGIPELLDEKYIFDKSDKNENEIAIKINSVSKDDMIVQAQRNFEKAKEYDENKIEKRRQDFFRFFMNREL